MYKQFNNPDGSTVQTAIIRTTDGTCIPLNLDNTDYQAYLKWLEEGNTPEPADE
jgi:hypothetical protein